MNLKELIELATSKPSVFNIHELILKRYWRLEKRFYCAGIVYTQSACTDPVELREYLEQNQDIKTRTTPSNLHYWVIINHLFPLLSHDFFLTIADKLEIDLFNRLILAILTKKTELIGVDMMSGLSQEVFIDLIKKNNFFILTLAAELKHDEIIKSMLCVARQDLSIKNKLTMNPTGPLHKYILGIFTDNNIEMISFINAQLNREEYHSLLKHGNWICLRYAHRELKDQVLKALSPSDRIAAIQASNFSIYRHSASTGNLQQMHYCELQVPDQRIDMIEKARFESFRHAASHMHFAVVEHLLTLVRTAYPQKFKPMVDSLSQNTKGEKSTDQKVHIMRQSRTSMKQAPEDLLEFLFNTSGENNEYIQRYDAFLEKKQVSPPQKIAHVIGNEDDDLLMEQFREYWASTISTDAIDMSVTPIEPDEAAPMLTTLFEPIMDEDLGSAINRDTVDMTVTPSDDSTSDSTAKIKMPIAPKYISSLLELTTFYAQQQESGNNKKRKTDALSGDLKTTQLIRIKAFDGLSSSSRAPQLREMHDEVMNLALYGATSKSALSSKDTCYFLMAGRLQEALVPALDITSNTRCVIVLNQQEYAKLSQFGALASRYDFLVIQRFNKSIDGREVCLSSLTMRRRAALHAAYVLELSDMIMMDDNIESFHSSSDEGSACNADTVYSSLQTLQKIDGEPILSVPTLINNFQKDVADGQLGCKLFMINIDFLKRELRDSSTLLALFPLNEKAWGEDYFMQIVSHLLLKDKEPHQKGFQIVNPEQMQITRSRSHINACRKQGIQAAPLPDPSDSCRALFGNEPALALHKEAIKHFNRLISEQVEGYQWSEDHRRKYNFAAVNAKKLGYAALAPLRASQLPFNEQLILNLKQFLDRMKLIEGGSFHLYPHQTEAVSFVIDKMTKSSEKRKRQDQLTFDVATGAGKTLIEAILAFQAFLASNTQHVVLICPTIQLVRQTRDALLSYAKHILTEEEAQMTCPRILAICAGEISQQMLDRNEHLFSPHIFVMCVDSFQQLLIAQSQSIGKFGYIIYDESHLVERPSHTATIADKKPGVLSVCFSATPEDNHSSRYIYTREEGIQNGILTPLWVDDSILSTAVLAEHKNLIKLLKTHRHPSDNLFLQEHKGIIYISSIAVANALAETITQNCPDFPVFEVHSRQAEKTIVEQFKAAGKGVAIAIRMLVEGFDEATVDFAIIAKTVGRDSLIQIIGRLLRKNTENPTKIGLAILTNELNRDGFFRREKTCFPSEGFRPTSYTSARNTLVQSQVKSPQQWTFLGKKRPAPTALRIDMSNQKHL